MSKQACSRFHLCAAVVGLVLMPSSRGVHGDELFLRGDANTDGYVSISDVVFIYRYLFRTDPVPPCLDAVDVGDDAEIDLTDYIKILRFLFMGGEAPPDPFPAPGSDPTPLDDLDCAAYDAIEPAVTQDIVMIGDFSGAPGETVAVPVSVTNYVPLEAYQLVIRYDPAQLVLEQRHNQLSFEGTLYEAMWQSGNSRSFAGFNADPEAGVFVIAFVPDIFGAPGSRTPVGEDQLVLKFLVTISPDLAPGTEINLDPVEPPDGYGPAGLRCELCYKGDARYASVIPKVLGGQGGVNPDVLIFRGDTNDNGAIEMADAVLTLNWLFQGSEQKPWCMDAADTDDNGAVELTDAIRTLGYLFLGGPAPAPPFPEIAKDPTEDDLETCSEWTPTG